MAGLTNVRITVRGVELHGHCIGAREITGRIAAEISVEDDFQAFGELDRRSLWLERLVAVDPAKAMIKIEALDPGIGM
jgi:hypothetical protein